MRPDPIPLLDDICPTIEKIRNDFIDAILGHQEIGKNKEESFKKISDFVLKIKSDVQMYINSQKSNFKLHLVITTGKLFDNIITLDKQDLQQIIFSYRKYDGDWSLPENEKEKIFQGSA